jgi:3-oxoacyl-[acyl-carrier-protein] synthase-3
MYTQGHSRLISTGVYVPEQRVSSNEILEQIDSKNRFNVGFDWLERTTGIRERRVSPENMMPSDMAVIAARDALERAELPPSGLDVIIYAGVDRDFIEPATAHIVQDKLKASNAVVFDVTNACHGFMNGIHLLDALIATGQARRGMVVTGEQGFRASRKAMEILSQTHDREVFVNLAGGLTVGDAGAALILGPKVDPDTGFIGFMLRSRGEFADLCVCGTRGSEETPLKTDMPNIVKHHIQMHADMFALTMTKLGWSTNDITRFVHHQVGLKAFKMHAAYSQLSTNIMSNTVATMGNLVSATIPVNLYNLAVNQEVRDGDKIFISGAGSGLSISQAGLIWEAA